MSIGYVLSTLRRLSVARDPKRITWILHDIGIIWDTQPDLRLGQLLGNLREDLYHIEDEMLVKLLTKFYKGHAYGRVKKPRCSPKK